MTTANYHSSPSTSPTLSGASLGRQRERGSYVQRWKVLRDRNKNLPKLDFNAKATGIPKKYQAPGFSTSITRSYTYDAIKLPSISNGSVITGVSNTSTHSDGAGHKRRNDPRDNKKAPPYQVVLQYARWKMNTNQSRDQSEPSRDLTETGSLGLNKVLSTSLNTLTVVDEPVEGTDQSRPDSFNKHRYERISYTKRLSNRHNTAGGVGNGGGGGVGGGGGGTRADKDTTSLISGHTRDKEKAGQNDLLRRERDNIMKDLRRVKNASNKLSRQQEAKIQAKRKEEAAGEMNSLEQSRIYQLDFSNFRNEIPPVTTVLPPVSANSDRSYHSSRERSGKEEVPITKSDHKSKRRRQKWKDDCDCLRCQIIKRQFTEGDQESYKVWGNYPCQRLINTSRQTPYYDSD